QNGRIFQRFLDESNVALLPDRPVNLPDRRTLHQKHELAEGISARTLYDSLLTRFRIPGADDNERWLATLFLIERWLDIHPSASAGILRMRPHVSTSRAVVAAKLENPF